MVAVNVLWLLLVCLCHLGVVSSVFGEPGMGTGFQSKALAAAKRMKPSQAFHFAYQDYLKGHYDLALSEFQQVVDDFPESALASEAYFYIGECYDQQGNLKEAARALTTLIEQHGTSRQVPAALFKLGKVMVKAGHPHKAKAYWSKLIKDFRGSPEAKLAKGRLKRLP
jgi:tol-pal system protein YbgF